jgi:hypothetical protein
MDIAAIKDQIDLLAQAIQSGDEAKAAQLEALFEKVCRITINLRCPCRLVICAMAFT